MLSWTLFLIQLYIYSWYSYFCGTPFIAIIAHASAMHLSFGLSRCRHFCSQLHSLSFVISAHNFTPRLLKDGGSGGCFVCLEVARESLLVYQGSLYENGLALARICTLCACNTSESMVRNGWVPRFSVSWSASRKNALHCKISARRAK